ncbi:MAG: exonuclease subunit SbcD [Clostridiales bacterium]|nr:exonuclease subunit SbcD [Clostridiales bacterium]
MTVLHTSDWHIGKRLMDRERLEEQIEALDEISEICDREGVEVVLVAGDVFDTYLPPAEAEEVFYCTVKKLAGEHRAVVVVSGNHDDGVRVAAAAALAEEHGIYIFGNQPTVMRTGSDRPVHVVASGEGYILLENEKGERLYINALPYPNEARFKEEKTEETYPEKVARWISRGEAGYDKAAAHIILSHLFVAGGKTSESERDIDLGGARAVPVRLFPEGAYVALGHLHKKQKLGESVYYSGSLLQYSFDEANTQKCVIVFDTQGNAVNNIREVPLRSGKKLVRLECNGVPEALALLPQYENSYIELTLHLDAPLSSMETQALGDANRGLVSLIALVAGGESTELVCRSRLSSRELFSEYYQSVYGTEADGALTEAFLSLLTEEV